MSSLFDETSIPIAQKGLDAVWLRQKVISANIANIDTPGYKSKYVEFEDVLKNKLGDGSLNSNQVQSALNGVDPQVKENSYSANKEDGNNVDAESENIEMARAQIQYEYLTRSVASEFSRLKYAVTSGGK